MAGADVRQMFQTFLWLLEEVARNLIHRLAMVLAWEQVPVAIHRDRKRCVASKRLHRLRREALLDPTRDSKMPQAVPAHPADAELAQQGQELPLDQIVMPHVPAQPIGEDQILRS